MMPAESPLTEPLNGLKSQVHRPPLSLSMVRVPPTFGWAVVLPDDVEEPHADATIAIAASAAARARRFPLIFQSSWRFAIAFFRPFSLINRPAGSAALACGGTPFLARPPGRSPRPPAARRPAQGPRSPRGGETGLGGGAPARWGRAAGRRCGRCRRRARRARGRASA